jgi:hypothetical protein
LAKGLIHDKFSTSCTIAMSLCIWDNFKFLSSGEQLSNFTHLLGAKIRRYDIVTLWTAKLRFKGLHLAKKTNNANFRASVAWSYAFLKRHNLSIRRWTHIAQKLPSDYEDQLSLCIWDNFKFLSSGEQLSNFTHLLGAKIRRYDIVTLWPHYILYCSVVTIWVHFKRRMRPMSVSGND